MKAIHRSTRDHSIQFFSRLLFLLLVVNTLINLLIGGISRNFIKHQNMLHLEMCIRDRSNIQEAPQGKTTKGKEINSCQ